MRRTHEHRSSYACVYTGCMRILHGRETSPPPPHTPQHPPQHPPTHTTTTTHNPPRSSSYLLDGRAHLLLVAIVARAIDVPVPGLDRRHHRRLHLGIHRDMGRVIVWLCVCVCQSCHFIENGACDCASVRVSVSVRGFMSYVFFGPSLSKGPCPSSVHTGDRPTTTHPHTHLTSPPNSHPPNHPTDHTHTHTQNPKIHAPDPGGPSRCRAR
jgi:hypothetical protein